ncbi:hypothetical protein [Rhodococcus sp. NPDC055024]
MQPRHANKPAAKQVEGQKIRLSWPDILGEWASIELDFQDWNIDLESGVLKERSWRWMNRRIFGLVANPESRLHKALKIPLTHTPE